MRIYKRNGSRFYSYEFWVNKKRIQKATKLTNAEAAKTEMTRHRTCLVKGEPFIPSWKQIAPAPAEASRLETFSEFEETFMQWVRSDIRNSKTVKFYAATYKRLARFLGHLPLDQIDEPKIEILKLRLIDDLRTGEDDQDQHHTTCNRHLACLKKSLRYASINLRKFDRIPRIKLYGEEQGREYTFSADAYRRWLEVAPEPLKSCSILAHESGITRNEMLGLRKDAVQLNDYGDADDMWGTIKVIRNLKRKARRRDLPITRAMAEVLREQMKLSQCDHVFSSLRDRKQPLSGDTLGIQHTRMIKTGEFEKGAGLHAFRHGFLTSAARVTPDVKALMRIAGHSQISTTMKYVHPSERDVIAISATLQRQHREAEQEAAVIPAPASSESLQKRLQ